MTNFANLEAIRAAASADLVSYWNENLHEEKKPIKKFSDRKTAESRVIALWESLNGESLGAAEDEPQTNGAAPADEEDDARTEEEIAEEEKQAAAGIRALQFITQQMHSVTEARENSKNGDKVKPGQEGRNASPMAAKTRASNAAGVSASWSDPEVLAARLTRNGTTVTVDGATSEHRSVREAFRHYRLPDSKHIRFRLALKASKKETFEHNGKKYVFVLQD